MACNLQAREAPDLVAAAVPAERKEGVPQAQVMAAALLLRHRHAAQGGQSLRKCDAADGRSLHAGAHHPIARHAHAAARVQDTLHARGIERQGYKQDKGYEHA